MYRAGKLKRSIAKILPALLALTIIQALAPTQSAYAGTQAPTITLSITSGAAPKTSGGGEANSLVAQIGKPVAFKVVLEGLTVNQLPIGQIRVAESTDPRRRAICTTTTFIMTGDSATATCEWTPVLISGFRFKAHYSTDLSPAPDYSSVISAETQLVYVAGINKVTGLNGVINASETKTIVAETYQGFGGQISFNANGAPITGCQNLTANPTASCPYFIPANTQTIIFTFDYTPTNVAAGLTVQRNSYPLEITVASYYYPSEASWYQTNGLGYDTTYNADSLTAKFYQTQNVFFKLNASNGQAVMVSYNRRDLSGTSLTIPETFTVSSLGGAFNRTYTVTQIGPSAMAIINGTNGTPTTLLTSVSIPNTVTVIGDGAFQNQCNIRSLTMPDSVRVIGTAAFNNMKIGNSVSKCATGVSGLETLTVGSGLETLADNAMKNLGNLRSLIFRGSPDSMVPVLSDPAGFDPFQWGNFQTNRLASVGSIGVNACAEVITYTNAITAYLMGSQANKWKYWATDNGCIPYADFNTVDAQFAPSAPFQPVAETPTISSLYVSWKAPFNNGDSLITGYSVQYSSNNGSSWTQSSCTSCQIGSSPYLVSGLEPATSYIFRVIATNAIGASAPSIPSVPVSTLNYTSAPAFSITPASETLTAGSATTYSLTSTYPAASYSISPSAGNGLTFNTTTGVLSGSVASIDSAVAYAVTGTNVVGSHTETYTVTVIAAPVTPPAPVQVSTPDPVQTSRIASTSLRCIKPDTFIEVKGSFEAKVVNISINGKYLPAGQWSQSANLISIKWAENLNSNIEIQIFNGQVPVLMVQKLTFVNQCAVEEAQVVTPTPAPTKSPTPTPSPTPTKVVNTQPTAEMKKISMLNFALGSYAVTKTNKGQILRIAAEIMNSSVKTVLIYGHTDAQGGVNNTILSKNRAQAIVKQIRPLLKGKSIKIGWYAATKPVATGKSKAAYAQNRRVEIWVK